jgi:hypothetical protein
MIAIADVSVCDVHSFLELGSSTSIRPSGPGSTFPSKSFLLLIYIYLFVKFVIVLRARVEFIFILFQKSNHKLLTCNCLDLKLVFMVQI